MSAIFFVGHAWSALAQHIAQGMSALYYPVIIDQFSDQEVFTRTSSLPDRMSDRVVVVYQIMYGNDNSIPLNDQLFGLFSVIDSLKQRGAGPIDLVMPYLPYSRQDYDFEKKRQGFIFALGICLKALSVARVFVCDLHARALQQKIDPPVIAIPCEPLWQNILQKTFKHIDRQNLCVASPDAGGWDRVQTIAGALNIAAACVQKRRDRLDQSVAYQLDGDVKDKVVILIDDIIDTGATAISACKLLRSAGARMIYGFFTHAIFSNAVLRDDIKKEFVKIFVSNSVMNAWVAQESDIELVLLDELIISALKQSA